MELIMKKFLLVLVLAIFTSSLFSFGGDGKMRGDRFMGGLEQCEELNLTTIQKEKIEQLRSEMEKVLIDLRAKGDKLRVEKREANLNSDFSKLRELNSKLSTIREERGKLHLNFRESAMFERFTCWFFRKGWTVSFWWY
jgi:hypothetical protein